MCRFIIRSYFILQCFVSVAFLLFGCQSKVAHSEIEPHEINLDNLTSDALSFDSLFYDIEFIPLENNRDAMLSFVPKLIVTKEKYLVLNLGAYPSVLLFDQEGRFQCQVGRLGHGQGEYEYVFDITTDDEDNIVLSTFDRFMIYDSRGKFRRSEKAPEKVYMKNILGYAGGLICASNYSGSASLLYFLNKSYEQDYEMLPSNAIALGNPPRLNKSLNIQGDTLCYFNPYTSEITLISLSEQKMLKHYSLISKNMLTMEKSKKEETPQSDIGDIDATYYYYIANGKIVNYLSYQGIGAFLEIDVAHDKCTLRIQNGWFPGIFGIQNN